MSVLSYGFGWGLLNNLDILLQLFFCSPPVMAKNAKARQKALISTQNNFPIRDLVRIRLELDAP